MRAISVTRKKLCPGPDSHSIAMRNNPLAFFRRPASEKARGQPEPELFDRRYYSELYPDVADPDSAWAHFLAFGAKEGRFAHPLFDTARYLRLNPDVARSGVNPLLHYIEHGGPERRSAHPLFDEGFYCRFHPEVDVIGANPLLHFLQHGTGKGHNPNCLFDVHFYLTEYPDVQAAGINPLVHYVCFGAAEGRDPHPLFSTSFYLERNPDIARSGTNPLRHYLEHGQREGRMISRPLLFSNRTRESETGKASKPNRRAERSLGNSQVVPVFCVYGPSNVPFINDIVIPAFDRQKMAFRCALHFVNYRSQQSLVGNISSRSDAVIEIKDWSDTRPAGHLGFGEAINCLFDIVNPPECFVLCNPDSFPMPDCLARLGQRYMVEDCGMVEASQWPSPHPKEFDPVSLETPWASGAFTMISARAFRELKGFDPTYFLYLEDVDLSWRAWLAGHRVLHEPLALCGHATGLHSYRAGRYYYEHFFSLRNFIVISYKFFGDRGERAALEHLKKALLPASLHDNVLTSYQAIRPAISVYPAEGQNADKIKILGLNLFHELRN